MTEGGLRQDLVVEERLLGTTIWVRMPMPLIFGDVIADAARTGTPLETNFLYSESSGSGVRYRVDTSAIAKDEAQFAARLSRVLQVTRGGLTLEPTVVRWRVRPRLTDQPFRNPDDARASMDTPSTDLDPVFGEAIIEFELAFRSGVGSLRLEVGIPTVALPAAVDCDTYVVRRAPAERPVMIAQAGQLDRAVILPNAIWQSRLHQVWNVAATPAGLVGLFFLALSASVQQRGWRLSVVLFAAFAIGFATGVVLAQSGWVSPRSSSTTGAAWGIAFLVGCLVLAAVLRRPEVVLRLPLWPLAIATGLILGLRVPFMLIDGGPSVAMSLVASSFGAMIAWVLCFALALLILPVCRHLLPVSQNMQNRTTP